MDLNFTYCEDGAYSKEGFQSKIRKRVLHHPNKGKIEVKCIFLPEIEEHSDGKLNVLFEDKDTSLELNDRKYFAKISWWQKRELIWMYGQNWWQKQENIWKVANLLLGFVFGYFAHAITH